MNILFKGLLFSSIGLLAACATTRQLVVQSNPPDANVYIKGFDKDYFPKDKVFIGKTPLKLSEYSYTDEVGQPKTIRFNEVEDSKFYVLVEKSQYETLQSAAPPLVHNITLKQSPEMEISRKLIESVEGDRNTGTVKVISTPAGAKVFVNGEFRGNTPYDVIENPGKYWIRVELPHYKDVNEQISIGALDARVLHFELLESADQVAKVGQSGVTLTSTPSGAEVYLNGDLVGNTPYDLVRLPSSYSVQFKYPHYREKEESVVVEDGKMKNIHVKLEKRED